MVERPMLQQTLHLGRFSFWRLVLVTFLVALSACGASGPERTVRDVTLLETSPSELDTDEALQGLATAAPRTLFWIERERDVYDANLVARDLERIERFYRARGYYDVKVVAARVERVSEREVAVEVRVTPGPRVKIRKVTSDPRVALSDAALAYKDVPLPTPGQPFEEAALARTEQRIVQDLREAGFAYVTAKTTATVDLAQRAADIEVQVDPGPRSRIGKVRVVGLQKIPERKVRALLALDEGTPYSTSLLNEAQSALSKWDLFSRVDVSPDLSDRSARDVPVIVTLQEAKLRKITLGGGTQIDSLQVEGHLRTAWEHKNFLGGARRFEVSAKGGAVVFANRLETWDTLTQSPTRLLPVVKLGTSLQQPALFNGRTSGGISVDYAVSPLLYPLEGEAKDEIVIGYHKPTLALGLSRTFWGDRITIEPGYRLEAKVPFTYQNPNPCSPEDTTCVTKELQSVWVSYPRLTTTIENRPGDFGKNGDRNDPDRRDIVLSLRNTVELAGFSVAGTRYFGGSVSDLKIEPEARATLPLSSSKRTAQQPMNDVILALRFKVGFLLLADYGNSLRTDRATSQSQLENASTDQQKLLFRAFYSGGATSNRGYAPQAISPHGPVGFLIPTGVNCVTNADDPRCIRPLGGFTQWEASLELRYLGLYPLGLVTFADAADVTRDIARLNFRYPHISVGPGVRYYTAVGLLRLDFGIRVPGWQALGSDKLPLTHGKESPEFLLGLPAALNLTLGEAF